MRDRTEQLTLIFTLQTSLGPEVDFDTAKLRLISSEGGISGERIFELIVSILDELSLPLQFEPSGRSIMSADKFLKLLRTRGDWWAPVVTNNLTLAVGRLPAKKHSFLLVKEKVPGAAGSWDTWARRFFCEPEFVQAWISDVEYDRWQNASNPIEYEAFGRDYSRLPMRSNELPSPLEQSIIDTSKNPGRWTIQDGYREAVGSKMWLANHFWRTLSKAPPAPIESAGFSVRLLGQEVWEIAAADQTFKDESTAATQNKLRTLIY